MWGLFHPSLMFFAGVGAVVVLWFGGGQVVRGAITLGDFVAFSFYLTMLMWPMIALGWVTNLFQRGAASMGRLNELFDIVPAVRDPESPVSLTSVRGALEFDDVSFRYPGTERDVLRDVSFRIEPGQTVADGRRDRERQVHVGRAHPPSLRRDGRDDSVWMAWISGNSNWVRYAIRWPSCRRSRSCSACG